MGRGKQKPLVLLDSALWAASLADFKLCPPSVINCNHKYNSFQWGLWVFLSNYRTWGWCGVLGVCNWCQKWECSWGLFSLSSYLAKALGILELEVKFARMTPTHWNVWFGKRINERAGDEGPLVSGWLWVMCGVELQPCCGQLQEVKVSNRIWKWWIQIPRTAGQMHEEIQSNKNQARYAISWLLCSLKAKTKERVKVKERSFISCPLVAPFSKPHFSVSRGHSSELHFQLQGFYQTVKAEKTVCKTTLTSDNYSDRLLPLRHL